MRIQGKNPIRWLVWTWRRQGLGRTVAIATSVVLDHAFDLRYGTDTGGRIHPTAIKTDSDNKAHSSYYGATKARPFLRLLRKLALPRECVFVDLGSGKGRVVMLASQYGFRKVVGVEFSPELCAVARENVRKFARSNPSPSVVEIVESDVTQLPLHGDERVFFMFDPFNAPVLSHVLENIRHSVNASPRPVWLIYNSPREQRLVDASGIFPHHRDHVVSGGEFRVYSNQPLASSPAHT